MKTTAIRKDKAEIEEHRKKIKAASQNKNTKRAYQGAIDHFLFVYKGSLPCSVDELETYLIACAGHLSCATIQQRRVMIGKWHMENGYENPSDTTAIRDVMKGIRVEHGKKQDQAPAIKFQTLKLVVEHLDQTIYQHNEDIKKFDPSKNSREKGIVLQSIRNKAMMLVAFWFGFRSDELINLRLCDVTFLRSDDSEQMKIYIKRSKTDQGAKGREVGISEMDELCPLNALRDWIEASNKGLTEDSARKKDDEAKLFVKVTAWGTVSGDQLHINSINKLLKKMFVNAGVDRTMFTSHSFRHGIANWLSESNTSLKDTQDWVGWRDPRSAMRYQQGRDALPNIVLANLNKSKRILDIEERLITKAESQER